MQRFNFNYDKGNDDLFLFNGKSKSKGSIELGSIILDFNNKMEIVGIQIMNASKFIKDTIGEYSLQDINQILNNLRECKIDLKINSNMLFIKMYFISTSNKEISYSLVAPQIKEQSPALAYN